MSIASSFWHKVLGRINDPAGYSYEILKHFHVAQIVNQRYAARISYSKGIKPINKFKYFIVFNEGSNV
jgi:hypothetical protein